MPDIQIRGARTHNLKNIDLDLPRDKLIVLTGLSGSGKSSLAFDTLYAEGQRRYVESLSSYARQFLELMDKPDVDRIDGLTPAIAIEQKSSVHNARSTVGTITEIYDYLRLLFSRVGTPYCPDHHVALKALPTSAMTDKILRQFADRRIMVVSPVTHHDERIPTKLLDDLQARGYSRFRISGKVLEVEDLKPEILGSVRTFEVVVDRLRVRADSRQRINEALEDALRLSDGLVSVIDMDGEQKEIFSDRFACPYCGYTVHSLEPKLFSFNSPSGYCPTCLGLGEIEDWDVNKIVSQKDKTVLEGAIEGWSPENPRKFSELRDFAEVHGIDLNKKWSRLSEKSRRLILYGDAKEDHLAGFNGVISEAMRKASSPNVAVRESPSKWKSLVPCPVCSGSRLCLAARHTYIGEGSSKKSIQEISSMSLSAALKYFARLDLKGMQEEIARKIVAEITSRLQFLNNVGLSYLALDRRSDSLSGGESQRIRLASQIGTRLSGVLYVLDEPSIGLHQSDNGKLISTLRHLRDLGNTVVVVEHDEDTIRQADFVVDMGPGAGLSGGEICAFGTPRQIEKNPNSLTGKYLSGKLKVSGSGKPLQPDGRFLVVKGCNGNNLKNIDVSIPVGLMTTVTGVSGSGKSTLVNDTIYRIAASELNGASTPAASYRSVEGIRYFDKVINVDQSPIGKSPRSNPATYTGVFSGIRELFAQTPLARERGYGPARFSFNVKGGRCEACEGEGLIKVEMNFLPDVYVACDVCHGARYNRETLEVRYKGLNISEVLDLTVTEALNFFANVPAIARKLKTLADVGLGYIKLGQSAVTLSGGEAQRVKLAQELSKKSTGKTLYILDEPTTGLHFHDVSLLLKVLEKLKQAGNTLLIIEHNLDIIQASDWVIDLGPEGGDRGGRVIAACAPNDLRTIPSSKTGQFLGNYLKT